MQILHILEEGKFSKSEYAYHATYKQHAKSILKHGLIPNKSEGGYGSNDTSPSGYSQAPLYGVYFTKSARDAIYIANSLSKDGVIVVAKIQQNGSATLDEDRLVDQIIDETEFRRFAGSHLPNFREFDDYEEYVEHYYDNAPSIIKSYIKDSEKIQQALSLIKNDNVRQTVTTELEEYLHAVLDIVAQVSEDDSERLVKYHQSNLTKMLRNVMRTKNRGQDFKTFKVDGPVGFRGANRIVGMYNVLTKVGWGDIGALESYAYHVASTPQRMLKDE